MKPWAKKFAVALAGSSLWIVIYTVCVFDNWYDPTNLFAEIMFFGAFFGFPLIIFAFHFIAMWMISKRLKMNKAKHFRLKLFALTVLGFAAFHSLFWLHGTIGNAYMNKNIEEYAFGGDVDAYAKKQLDALEQETGYRLSYRSSQYKTDFYTFFSGSDAGNYSTESGLELEIAYFVETDSCDARFCEGMQVYRISYEPETFEAANREIPLREAFMLDGLAGEYQEENGGNYFYNIRITAEAGYLTEHEFPSTYQIHFDELSSSGYWDKEAENYVIYIHNDFPNSRISGIVSSRSDELKPFDGQKADVFLEDQELTVRIDGGPSFIYYRK